MTLSLLDNKIYFCQPFRGGAEMLDILTPCFDFGGRSPCGDSEDILTIDSEFGGHEFFKNQDKEKKYIFGQVKIFKN